MPLHSLPSPLFFPVNQAIEPIFSPENIDEDCDTISRLMLPVENAIEQYLFDGDYAAATARCMISCSISSAISSFAGNFANYEGMCVGPTLSDGSIALVLIPDSQNSSNGLTNEYVKIITVK